MSGARTCLRSATRVLLKRENLFNRCVPRSGGLVFDTSSSHVTSVSKDAVCLRADADGSVSNVLVMHGYLRQLSFPDFHLLDRYIQ